jgi:hypothetical protein
MSSRRVVVAGDNYFETLNARFAEIKNAAVSTEAELRFNLIRMGDILADIYDFGYDLRKDWATYEKFIRERSNKKNPIGKKARENNWHPLLHIIFDDQRVDQGDISRWSRSMMYIFQTKYPQMPTREYIAGHGPLYKFLEAAQRHLNPIPELNGDEEEGKDFEQPEVGSVPPGSTSDYQAFYTTINSSLRHLAIALRGLRSYTTEEFIKLDKNELAVPSRGFVIFNTAAGCTVLMVARTRTFACGEARLPQPLTALGTHAYYLEDPEAGWLVDQFAVNSKNWRLEADGTVAAFESSHGVRIEARSLNDMPYASVLRCEGFFSRLSPTLTIDHSQARSVDKWRTKRASWINKHRSNAAHVWNVAEQRRNFLDGAENGLALGPYRASPLPSMPTMFDLRCQQGEIQVGYFEQLRIAGAFPKSEYMVIAQASAPFPIMPERWLKQEDVRNLRKTLMACQQPARAWLADGDIAQCALVVEAESDDVSFRAVLPLANTLTGTRAPACTRLAEKAIIPVNIEPVPSASSASQAPAVPLPLPALPAPVIQHAQQLSGNSVNELVRAQFAAYITCFRSLDELQWSKRSMKFREQLEWWMDRTNIPLFLLLSGWSKRDVETFNTTGNGILDNIKSRGGDYERSTGKPLIKNRIECLNKFYSTKFLWGIIMDDDAILYDDPQHNSSYRLFDEMAINGFSKYNDVDVIFPLNPQKSGFNNLVNGTIDGVLVNPINAERHQNNHVFVHNLDLKGSMFIVKNFKLIGKEAVIPDASFSMHGEDTYFALLATALGYKVRRCNNIQLKELTNGNTSYFSDGRTVQERMAARRRSMQVGNIELARMFRKSGFHLRMWKPCDPQYFSLDKKTGKIHSKEHLLFVDDFVKQCLGKKPKKFLVPKPT